jgi:hypothetical protein
MHIISLIALCASFLGAALMSAVAPAHAQDSVAITVEFAPPPLPVYDQPPVPGSGYIWVPGYWAWGTDVGWYWVPATWVLPPAIGLLWTPAYWAYSDGAYVLYDGYWAPEVGFYGGIDYGFGYTGYGYEGGYWNDRAFFYNTAVNNVTNVSITNVYHKPVVDRNRTRISYNGGPGGVRVRPTPAQLAVARERHVPATPEQRRHVEAAARDPAMALSQNHGHPAVAATSHAARFRGPGVVVAHPGRPIPAVPPTAARAARQSATMPTPRHATAPGAPARHLVEPTPRMAPPVEPTRRLAGARHQAFRPHVAQPSAPMRHFAGPMTGSHPVAGPRIARPATPERHLLMTAPHSAFSQQPHFAAPSHPAAAAHFGAAPHLAAPPHPAAAAPHFAAAPGGGARGGPPGRHR